MYNVIGLGELDILDVFDYYDAPVLFSCVSTKEPFQHYLAILLNEIGDYLYVPLSEQRLKAVRKEEVSIREAFLCEPRLCVVSASEDIWVDSHEMSFVFKPDEKVKPLPLEELYDAKFDRVHQECGRSRAAKTVRNRDLYIAIEGIDGSGKSTQAELLAQALNYELTCEPHDRSLAHLRGSPEDVCDAFLMDRKRWFAQRTNKKPLVTDRSLFTTAAYQSFEGPSWKSILDKHREAGVPFPALVIYIDVPVSVALARIGQRGTDACHWERREALSHVRQTYLEMNLHCPKPVVYVCIDGTNSKEAVHLDVLEAFSEYWKA